jgi:hypothetical protein
MLFARMVFFYVYGDRIVLLLFIAGRKMRSLHLEFSVWTLNSLIFKCCSRLTKLHARANGLGTFSSANTDADVCNCAFGINACRWLGASNLFELGKLRIALSDDISQCFQAEGYGPIRLFRRLFATHHLSDRVLRERCAIPMST